MIFWLATPLPNSLTTKRLKHVKTSLLHQIDLRSDWFQEICWWSLDITTMTGKTSSRGTYFGQSWAGMALGHKASFSVAQVKPLKKIIYILLFVIWKTITSIGCFMFFNLRCFPPTSKSKWSVCFKLEHYPGSMQNQALDWPRTFAMQSMNRFFGARQYAWK